MSARMLRTITLQNFRALRDLSVAFEPLTVVIGPNGSGKTSLLDAIEFPLGVTPQQMHWSPPEGNNHFNDVISRNAGGVLQARLESDEGMVAASWSPGHSYPRLLGPADPSKATPVVRRLRLDIGSIAEPSFSNEAEPTVGNDGSGVATVLSWLQGERDPRFEEIERRLREFVPDVKRLRTRRIEIERAELADIKVGEDHEGRGVFEKRAYKRKEIGHQVVIDYQHADGVLGNRASEGTLLLLALIITTVTSGASTLLIDDIERGLHPKAQQQLVQYLNAMTNRGLQVIATSHSPYLLMHLEYDQIRAMTLAGERGAVIGKLSDHPEFSRWREEMSPSEFWTVFGEQWLADQRAHG